MLGWNKPDSAARESKSTATVLNAADNKAVAIAWSCRSYSFFVCSVCALAVAIILPHHSRRSSTPSVARPHYSAPHPPGPKRRDSQHHQFTKVSQVTTFRCMQSAIRCHFALISLQTRQILLSSSGLTRSTRRLSKCSPLPLNPIKSRALMDFLVVVVLCCLFIEICTFSCPCYCYFPCTRNW